MHQISTDEQISTDASFRLVVLVSTSANEQVSQLLPKLKSELHKHKTELCYLEID